MLLDLLPLSDKSVYRRDRIGGGRTNLRLLPFVDQFLNNDTITYRKSEEAPHLELAHSWIALGVTTPEISEFRTQAFQAAVDKARELGWI